MSGSVELDYAAEDYAQAALLHTRVVMLSRKGLWAFVALWAFYWALIVWINGDISARAILITMVSTFAAAAVIAWLLLVLNRWLLPARARKLFAQQASLHDRFTIDWDEAGIRLRSARNHGENRWGEFTRWARNDRVLILYQSDALFNMLPARAMPAAALDEIAGLLAGAGVRKAG